MIRAKGYAIIVLSLLGSLDGAEPRVRLERVPNEGIQPMAQVDSEGRVHLIYFRGKPAAGDIDYVTRSVDEQGFSKPIRVNSQPGSAVAIGTIRNPQMAIGRNGRVHVAWNGSGIAQPKGSANPELPVDNPHRLSAPMLYSRLDASRSKFEPQRNLMGKSFALDGGGSVAADAKGNVYVVWHGGEPGAAKGEAGRAVFIVRSTNDGKSFDTERRINKNTTGACGCCSLKAYVSTRGGVHVLYRAATRVLGRDVHLLESDDLGKSFESSRVHAWNVPQCVMSSSAFAETAAGEIFVTWETKEQIYFASRKKLAETVAVGGFGKKRKHSVIACNASGDILVAWTEGTGWKRGGNLAWQVFDSQGKPRGIPREKADGVPIWGSVSAVANLDGSFTIFH